MKKAIISIILIISICAGFTAYAEVNYNAPKTLAESAVLMDAETMQVIYDKDMHDKKYPASITKIMTVILALENLDPDAMLTIVEEDVDTVPKDTAHIALDYGEEISVNDLIYAAMLASANDAANVLARGVSGSVEAFAKEMNKKAKEIGAVNTHFANANGLHDENHYTTAYDMALIMRYALANDTFRKVISTELYEAAPTNKQEEARLFANPHKMIKNSPYIYEGAIGGKNGWTTEAGYTLVTAAEKNGITFIAVVLGGRNHIDDKFDDTISLFDYGYDNFTEVLVTAQKLQEQFNGSAISKDFDLSSLYDAKFLIHNSENGQFITHLSKRDNDIVELMIQSQSGNTIYTRQYITAPDKTNSIASIIIKIAVTMLKIILGLIALFIMFIILAIIRNQIRIRRRRKLRARRNSNYYR